MFKSLFLAALMTLGTVTGALAQGGGLPQELQHNTRRMQGDQITFCLDEQSVGAPFDHRVGEAIASALLLKAKFTRAPSGFGLDAQGYLDELQIVMANECDVLLGISLQPNFPYPEWASPTRAYAQVPFVLAVTDPSYNSLADIPKTRKLGTALGSIGEYAFITYNQQLPEADRWKRLPYADAKLMVKRLKDGTLGGIILWGPSLSRAVGGDPAKAGLRVIDTSPVAQSFVLVGALVSSRDTFLRSQIDDAIASLISDGSMQAMLDEFGYQGKPGPQ
ncbi:hypothetical protein GCM10011321_43390 [Youhaiella tibetensis]|nr:transporter substrate-binding domain-containing protein [Youhaiella tibetensis]AKR56749.1 hypothetical protein XM25_13280 [Devosia sp. H5989]GGF48347.1 hypothetical protein GCM10011321_43390 [Youhaiella tibetensis]